MRESSTRRELRHHHTVQTGRHLWFSRHQWAASKPPYVPFWPQHSPWFVHKVSTYSRHPPKVPSLVPLSHSEWLLPRFVRSLQAKRLNSAQQDAYHRKIHAVTTHGGAWAFAPMVGWNLDLPASVVAHAQKVCFESAKQRRTRRPVRRCWVATQAGIASCQY